MSKRLNLAPAQHRFHGWLTQEDVDPKRACCFVADTLTTEDLLRKGFVTVGRGSLRGRLRDHGRVARIEDGRAWRRS